MNLNELRLTTFSRVSIIESSPIEEGIESVVGFSLTDSEIFNYHSHNIGRIAHKITIIYLKKTNNGELEVEGLEGDVNNPEDSYFQGYIQDIDAIDFLYKLFSLSRKENDDRSFEAFKKWIDKDEIFIPSRSVGEGKVKIAGSVPVPLNFFELDSDGKIIRKEM